MVVPIRRRSIAITAGTVWLAALAAGLGLLHGFAATPGRPGIHPREWPVGGPVVADPARANLVMLVHPRCPCSRASLAQLERIMAACRPHLAAKVLFLEPWAPAAAWRGTDLWRRAAAIPGARSIPDPGGAEARRFGAMTSGDVLLYDRSGRLLFSGGVTEARGYGGDNPGTEAVIRLVAGKPARARNDVFGCPLLEVEEGAPPPRERPACRR